MYVVETPKPFGCAPADKALVEAWIGRVATLRLDSATASAKMVIDRLQHFWIPAETVVYIGLAGTSLAKRVGQYYRTPLGDPRPHAGGHWIKTLASLDTFLVWFAESSDPSADEDALLRAFGDRHGSRSILPFANLEDARRVRKPNGITVRASARAASLLAFREWTGRRLACRDRHTRQFRPARAAASTRSTPRCRRSRAHRRHTR